nr:cytochrome c [Acuticoccus kalidii]
MAASLALLGGASAGAAEVSPEMLAEGKAVFTETAVPNCGICHTLADAGTAGMIGPVLDDLKPDTARVEKAVTSGVGVMPAYAETLSADEIEAVARYVATSSGGE